MSKKYEIMTYEEPILGYLMDLNIDSYKGRKTHKKSDEMGIYAILSNFLTRYGIFKFGVFDMGEYKIGAVTISKDFPVENERILKALYNFLGDDTSVHIGFVGDGDCAYEFQYNLHRGNLRFRKLIWGHTNFKRDFSSLSEFLEEARRVSKGKKVLDWAHLFKSK